MQSEMLLKVVESNEDPMVQLRLSQLILKRHKEHAADFGVIILFHPPLPHCICNVSWLFDDT